MSYSAFTTGKSGAAGSRITIARSVEAGRDGIVTIGSPIQVPSSYITIDGIAWDKMVETADVAAGGGGGGAIYITGDNFEVKHVKFNCSYAMGGGYHTVCPSFTCNTCLIQYCDFYKTAGEDHINWRGHTLLTVDHCVFTSPNPPNDGSHRDLMNPWETPGGGYDLYFTHNIVYNLPPGGFGMLFQDTAQVGNIHIHHNVFSTLSYVVQFGSGNHGAKSIEMHNNVFYNTTDQNGAAPAAYHKNDIFYGPAFPNSGAPVHNVTAGADHCLWFNASNFEAGTGNLNNTDPLFINVNSPLGADGIPFTADDGFNLRAGSPAINAGTSVGDTTDIIGNPIVGNPDIGAYEYGSSGGATPTPTPTPAASPNPPKNLRVVPGT